MNTVRVDNATESGPPQRTNRGVEPRMALPTCRMLAAVFTPLVLFAGGWCLAAAVGAIGPWNGALFRSGMLGASSTTAVAVAGVFIMTPWKVRAMGDWMTMWLASTVFRLLVTPLVVYLLYSAASQELAAKPLVLSVAGTYFVTLLAEAVILTTHIRRSMPSA